MEQSNRNKTSMLYKNAYIFINSAFRHGSFRVEGKRFFDMYDFSPAYSGVDLNGAYVIPSLVDIHSHGCIDHDFSDGDLIGIRNMGK